MDDNLPRKGVKPSTAFVAAITGKHRSTVSRYANAQGETVGEVLGGDGKVYAYNDARLARAEVHLRRRAEGLSLRQIAAETGASPTTVLRDIRAFRLIEGES